MKNKMLKIILSSLVILSPIAAGLLLWDRLPEVMPTHFFADGTVDSLGGRGFAVFTPPLILLAVHLLCFLFTAKDKSNEGQSPKVYNIIYWIIPAISLMANGVIYCVSLAVEINIMWITGTFLGLALILMGNYMPKATQNRTIGTKNRWTLADEATWNATHRFSGKVYVIAGVVLIPCGFILPMEIFFFAMLGIVLAAVISTTAYSYRYYKKRLEEGKVSAAPQLQLTKAEKRVTAILIAIVVVVVLVIMALSGVEITLGESSLTVESVGWSDATVEYDAITSVTYREDCAAGTRVYGVGPYPVLVGQYENDEFGLYTRYTYSSCKSCVVIESAGKILVIGGKDEAATREIYEQLCEKVK